MRFVPGLITNLVSVGAASSKGIATMFVDRLCKMLLDDEVVATGQLTNEELYVLNCGHLKGEGSEVGKAMVLRESHSIDEWHQALGHPCASRLEKLLKDESLEVRSTGQLSPCASCPAGKSQHAHHLERIDNEVKEVGDNVHVNLGFIKAETNAVGDPRYVYYLLCKDQMSEFSLIYFTDRISEVVNLLTRMIIDFEVGSGRTIRVISSDNESESCNKGVELLFSKERICHRRSAPYVP